MRKMRLLLFPFSGIYYLITLTRNKLYDAGILKSKKYNLPIICVGNLSVGGTGKTPMTEFVIKLLKDDYKVATLSRGYGRTTRGYLDVTSSSNALEVGDEPLQFAKKFDAVQVAVCERRQEGIRVLLNKRIAPELIVLDDAYQHRSVEAGLNILLTSYGDLYCDDYVLPAGNLREPRVGANRADIIVVTKCPSNLETDEMEAVRQSLKVQAHQRLFFSKIIYDDCVYNVQESFQLNRLKVAKVTVVTGIANPAPFIKYLRGQGLSFDHKPYKDHHNFTVSDLELLDSLDCILTTEKDYVRLQPLLTMKKIYYLPIRLNFFQFENEISETIREFVRKTI